MSCPLQNQFLRDRRVTSPKFREGFPALRILQNALPILAPNATAFSAGYSTVVFRGRHVADPIDLDDGELAGYWRDVRAAGAAIRTVFGPCHLNYQLLGNAVPHVHTHVIPRYPDDPAPGRPLPVTWDGPPAMAVGEFERQLGLLRAAVAGAAG